MNQEQIQQLLDNAWLGIAVDDNKIFNPFTFNKSYLEDITQYMAFLFSRPEYFSFICDKVLNVQILPFQQAILEEMWNRRFPMLIGSRGLSKTFMLALYCWLRLILMPGRRIIVTGAGFRQSKLIYEYMESIYNNSPVLKSALDGGIKQIFQRGTDAWTIRVGNGYARFLPVGDGQKIRGQRANDIITDEFASLDPEIFEHVISPFAAVSSSPIETVDQFARRNILKYLEKKDVKVPIAQKAVKKTVLDNQIIISGTAYYEFNHFAEYWKRWKDFAIAAGESNLNRIGHYFPDGIPDDFDPNQYSVIRIPVDLIPPGLMDESMIERSKATVHSGIYSMEYGAVFCSDTRGFFKRSTIESCTMSNYTDLTDMLPGVEIFKARLYGNPSKRYVFGIDPASEVDNFSIVILELHGTHRRVVYAWSTNSKYHKEARKRGETSEKDFYAYCAKQIRELAKRFPPDAIALDAQGGGIAVMEKLHDPGEGEEPILPIIDPDKRRDTDVEAGLHIIHPIQFANAEFTSESNHGMRKDLEDRKLLFPYVDTVDLAKIDLSEDIDAHDLNNFEEVIIEIEETKNELCTIEMSQTPSGRDKWDTPEIKLSGNKKGRMRKDRYSAILMANYVARNLSTDPSLMQRYDPTGGWAQKFQKLERQENEKDYSGPDWFVRQMNGVYD